MKQGELEIDYAPVLHPWIWSSLQYKVNLFLLLVYVLFMVSNEQVFSDFNLR